MKRSINIDVYGVSEVSSLLIAENILNIIENFEKLDLRRLHNIVITDVFERTHIVKENEFKDFNSSLAYAKVIIIPKEDDYEFVIVIRTDFAMNLIEENIDSIKYSKYLNAVHVLHHELCHVHDYNQCIDIFKYDFLGKHKKGKEMILHPLSQICWSEYIANYLSSSSARKSEMPKKTIDSFMVQIGESKIKIDKRIETFRADKDILSLMLFLKSTIEDLVKSSAYVLGYIHGMDKDIEKVYPKLHELINDSYFYYTWSYLNDVLKNMKKTYPNEWEEENVFENLIYGFDKLYTRLGIKLSENDRNELFFEVQKRE